MMVEEASSHKQQPNQIIQGVLGGLEPEGIELGVVLVKAEETIAITEVADEIQKIEALRC